MSPLLLLATLAFAELPDPAPEAVVSGPELLGPPSASAPLSVSEAGPSLLDTMPVLQTMPETSSTVPTNGWAWPVMLSGAGLFAAWQLRKRALSAAPSTLKVVQRHALGEKASLLVVDVLDGQGVARRLLVGAGANGLNLIQDLGEVAAPLAAPLSDGQLGALDDVAIPASDDDPYAAPSPRVDQFASLLDEELEDRGLSVLQMTVPQITPSPLSQEPVAARYFAPEDLAPVALEAPARVASPKRRAHFRTRFAANPSKSNAAIVVEPATAPELHAATAPLCAPQLRGASALLGKAPSLPAATHRGGLTMLVKGTSPARPAAAEPMPAPVLVSVPPPPALAPAPPPALPHSTRAVYVSPTMAQPASTPDRRVVGPPVRDPKLVTASSTPRLRLADPKTRVIPEARAASEAPIPSARELVDRLLAQAAAPAAPSPRPGGLKGRFEAIALRESARG